MCGGATPDGKGYWLVASDVSRSLEPRSAQRHAHMSRGLGRVDHQIGIS